MIVPELNEGDIKIESGYGIITSVQGPEIGLAEDISYTCTYTFPDGRMKNVQHQRPPFRYPPPLKVMAWPVGSTFPVMRVLGRHFVLSMPPELPETGPCNGGSNGGNGGGSPEGVT